MRDVHLLQDWKPHEDQDVSMKVSDMELEYYVAQQKIDVNLSNYKPVLNVVRRPLDSCLFAIVCCHLLAQSFPEICLKYRLVTHHLITFPESR